MHGAQGYAQAMFRDEVHRALMAAEVAGGTMLVGVSGGQDSVLLLAALSELAPRLDLSLIVAHVNHGLRADESEQDEVFVRGLAERAGWDFDRRRVDPMAVRAESANSRLRPTIEEAARDQRRAALEEMAEAAGARWIATAHHLGDQAETVMLRILRGTGPDGLVAMSPVDRSGRWIRPMLGILPETIDQESRSRGLVWREDSSNADRRFARNRLRHDWLPGLAADFNPKLLRNLANLAEAQSRDLEWIEGLVAEAAKERIESGVQGVRLTIDGWDAIPPALARRLAREALVRAGLGREVTRAHLERVLEFLRRGRSAGRDLRVELPEGIVLRRLDESFLMSRSEANDEIPPVGDATVPRRE